MKTTSKYHGVTRSLGFKLQIADGKLQKWLRDHEAEWKAVGESTSSHLKILSYEIDEKDDHLFLTIAADTDEAMGMNMVTIAAQAIGTFIAQKTDATFITVAANVDSDKKPSQRTHDKGRGYEATATCTLQPATITKILKTTPEALLAAAHAKLDLGSSLAGAIGHNCHAANIIAALYLATGQDTAHVVEGSLADTTVTNCKLQIAEKESLQSAICNSSMEISVRLPSIMLGIRGGGTTLPAQSQCLNLLLKSQIINRKSQIVPCRLLAEIFAATVLAGEISLLAAQSSHTLATAHKSLGRLVDRSSPPQRAAKVDDQRI